MCGVKRGDMKPEQVVEAYLDLSFNMKDVGDRELLLDLTTGNLKAAIEGAAPDTIKAAFIERRYEIQNYSVVERRDRTPRETEVSFQLTYLDLGGGKDAKAAKDAPKVTTENTVSVVRQGGVWLIRDVLGNKTAIDFPVSEESRITAKPGPGIDDEPTFQPDGGEAPNPAPQDDEPEAGSGKAG
jgi:hypothetical protein